MSLSKPSKEYFKNLKYYKKMHSEGFKLINGKVREAKIAYDGHSTLVFAKIIKNIITKNQITTMLDYGCGKAFYYDNPSKTNGLEIKSLKNYWDIDISLYDPCYEKYSDLKNIKYDLVISIDVLEHIPSQDIDWVLDNIIGKAKKYVFINLACYPAVALLPNGKNAHININEPMWWHEKILNLKRKYTKVKIICICALKENGNYKYFPLQYDDKISNYS